MNKDLVVVLPEKSTVQTLMYNDAPLNKNSEPREVSVSTLNTLIGKPFNYTNAIYAKDHPVDFSAHRQNRRDYDHLIKQFNKVGFADDSQFVICNMGAVGHGLFANKTFEPGECFILYSGLLTKKATARGDFSLDFEQTLDICVDSGEFGNVSRFIQHMPLNYSLCLERNKWLPSNVANNLNKDSSEFWEWRNLQPKSGLNTNHIAWANMVFIAMEINGVICPVLYNTCQINKGDQLGISYGIGYWIGRDCRPELFNLEAEIISPSLYGYKQVMISLPPIELLKANLNLLKNLANRGVVTSYNASMFQDDLKRKQTPLSPVSFHHLSEPVSLFDLRELLLKFNVIGTEYQCIEDEFIERVRSLLPIEFSAKMYCRNPANTHQKNVIDIVCKTKDLMKWSQLTDLVKNPQLIKQCHLETKCFKLTQEVIFLNISDLNMKTLLLTLLEIANDLHKYDQDLKPERIPKGPMHLDPATLCKVVNEEDIAQVIRHNPGFTKESIARDYQMIENLFYALANTDSTVTMLNELTMKFFNNQPKSEWKIYPSHQLSGRYIGHHVRFFNIPIENQSQSQPFFNKLVSTGFDAKLIKQNSKNSIVVDLTESQLKKH